jgi:heme-degrading monooxygenase HmoA
MDPAFPIERQLAVEASPVVLINVFTLDAADEQTFLQAWQDDADFMKQQPGFISTPLHRAIGESPTYLNYAVWESTADFRAAFTHPEFIAMRWTRPGYRTASAHGCCWRFSCSTLEPRSITTSFAATACFGACGSAADRRRSELAGKQERHA